MSEIPFGSRLRELRIQRGFTQRALVQKAGISVSFFSDVENGKRGLSAANLARLADVFGVTMDELWHGGIRQIVKVNGSTDSQLMCTAAMRYCLGRRSYIVGSCINWLRANWAAFGRNTQRVMVRDVIEALMDDRAGDPTIDVPDWRRFAEWGFERLVAEDQEWVCDAVKHKRKPWPLGQKEVRDD